MKASDLDIGDELVSIEIEEIPLDGSMFNINDWESTSLTNNGFVTTTITNIVSRQVQSVIVINGDVFSENHMILTRKDGIHKFVNTTEIDTSYEVFNYSTNSWNQVTSVDVLSNPTTVYSINCEPYDMFFTNEMLVYNIKENK